MRNLSDPNVSKRMVVQKNQNRRNFGLRYLDDKALAYKIRLDQQNKRRAASGNSTLIPWIETLWNIPLPDCRKRIIWLILSRYAVNNRKMTQQEAFIWIKNWADRCNAVTTVTGITNEYINYYITLATETGYFPPSVGTLEKYGWIMTGGVDSLDLIRNKMIRSS